MPPSLSQLEVPPFVPWTEWANRQPYEKKQGQHILFQGPTQSGKTALCRILARLRTYVVVCGTKPHDASLDAYVKEGYVRIEQWPPSPRDWKKCREVWGDQEARFILWPHFKKREDLRRFSSIFAALLDDVFIDGRWCVVVDEGLWMASPSGLGLGRQLGDVAYSTASNTVSLYLLVQRIANVPPVAWTSCSWAEIFHTGRTDDVRELASLGTYPPRTTAEAVRRLSGHRFLDLPCRGGAEWSITEADKSWL